MPYQSLNVSLLVLVSTLIVSCSSGSSQVQKEFDTDRLATSRIIVTNAAGAKFKTVDNVQFQKGVSTGTRIVISPNQLKQTIVGIGSSFTESSAYVLAHLPVQERREVMEKLFGEEGANFSLARTTIGSTDFSVEGKYSYAEVEGDVALKHFSIDVDKDGFKKAVYPKVKDESFDLLPMIKEALAIKKNQNDHHFNIVASAWTAPPWMKDIEDWFIPGSEANNYQGTGGDLKPQYVQTYADYLIRYLDAYQEEGISIWGLTPVNEPHGNSGYWESMHFSPKTQNTFIKRHLGPALESSGHTNVNVLIYDQNRDGLEEWTNTIFGDPETAPYVSGAAIHWYSSTYKVFEDVLDRVHEKFPDFSIIHTEGTIDNLGVEAPGGVNDPERYKESGWFDNDEFWWSQTATDWAYSATWAPNAVDHPIYTPVHRYARNIIVSLNHWVEGWIDWNAVLDRRGGPNHVGNFCGAPIMIDTDTGQIYYTPVYDVLAHFSRTIRPGDKAVQTDLHLHDSLGSDSLHASATVNSKNILSVQLLNTTPHAMRYALQIEEQFAYVNIDGNSLQTVQIQL